MRRMHLVERIIRMFLEFFPAHINTLLSPQARILLLNLRQARSLERGVGRFESAFGMSVDFIVVAGCCEGEGVESVVDTGGVEGGGFLACSWTGVVELGEIQPSALFDGGLCVFAFWFGALGGFFFGEEGGFFGLFTCCFGFLGFFSVSADSLCT